MMPGAYQPKAMPAEWHNARQIYGVYRNLAKHFSMAAPACPDLEPSASGTTPQDLTAVQSWLQEMDSQIQVHHLRLFFQTSTPGNEANIRALIRHHLQKKTRTNADRDKLDFLLVQYFSQCAPTPMLLQGRPAGADVAKVLAPALGVALGKLPPGPKALEGILERLGRCTSLRELLQQKILDDLRTIKTAAGEAYFGVPALVAFTRVNFLIRQTFFRLVHADLDAIRISGQSLEKHGVKFIDCTRARLSSAEPVPRVLALAQQWRKPFQAEYSVGNPFAQLAELRAAVEGALVKHGIARLAGADPFAQLAELSPVEEALVSGQWPVAGEKTSKQPAAGSKPETEAVVGSRLSAIGQQERVVAGQWPGVREKSGKQPATGNKLEPAVGSRSSAVGQPEAVIREKSSKQPAIGSKPEAVVSPRPSAVAQRQDTPAQSRVPASKTAAVQPQREAAKPKAAEPPLQPQAAGPSIVAALSTHTGAPAPPAAPPPGSAHSVSPPSSVATTPARPVPQSGAQPGLPGTPLPIPEPSRGEAESSPASFSTAPTLPQSSDQAGPLKFGSRSELSEEIAPPAAPAKATSAQLDLDAKLQMVLTQLTEYLQADRTRSRTMGATIVFGNDRLSLSSWEMRAFVDPAGSFSTMIQQGVAARVLMFQILAQARLGSTDSSSRSSGTAHDKLAATMALARTQAAQLQQAVGQARKVYDIDATVALSAAAQQLTNMLREAEQFIQGGKSS
jgi:hypothetical protein